jgi:hypothetical protein
LTATILVALKRVYELPMDVAGVKEFFQDGAKDEMRTAAGDSVPNGELQPPLLFGGLDHFA